MQMQEQEQEREREMEQWRALGHGPVEQLFIEMNHFLSYVELEGREETKIEGHLLIQHSTLIILTISHPLTLCSPSAAARSVDMDQQGTSRPPPRSARSAPAC